MAKQKFKRNPRPVKVESKLDPTLKTRFFIGKMLNSPQPVWKIKKPGDKKLSYFMLVHFRKYPDSPFGDD